MAFMLSQSLIIGAVVIVLTPLSVFAASFISKRIHSAFKEQSKITGELGGYSDEMISNRKLTAAFAYEHEAGKKFYEINKRLKICGEKAQFYSSLTNPATRFVNGLVYAAAGVAGAFLAVSSGTVSPGQISSFLAYANQYTKPFNEVSGVIAQLQSAIASASRVFSVIDVIPETDGESDNDYEQIPDEITGVVSAEHVSFSYVTEKPLIRDLNIEISPGSRVAIVGPTGCGKTTLINLLMRFYDVTGGKISVDGVDIKNMKRSSLRSMYGMVLQDTWLFDGTIRENIAYGCPDASDEEIESAAKDAHIHSFIRRLPDGYDTVISGDESSQISAGQKQLLCIARVMLAKTPMLILDEATSSIDTMTEVRISRAFAAMMKGGTSFIVAHRLSTIKNADLILVMRDGDIVETGNHGELLGKRGDYANLWNRQFSE
ncbi:atp-binding cassette sub-family b [Holotrichia oblita]|nr:atp-binding cassette sub-family b [Holotrichia oblita]